MEETSTTRYEHFLNRNPLVFVGSVQKHILYIHTFVQSTYICTCLGITCTPDLLESMCPPRSVSCLSTHTFVQSTYICTCLGITCTPDLLESMCPPRGVSCPSTHHIHRQSMSIPKNVSVSQYGGNVNNTIRTFLNRRVSCIAFR